MNRRPDNIHRGKWAKTLTPAQRASVTQLRRSYNGGRKTAGSDGWCVYMMPTAGPAKYLELRHYMTGGRTARWVIEKDGSVSADNDMGQSRSLRPVGEAAAA